MCDVRYFLSSYMWYSNFTHFTLPRKAVVLNIETAENVLLWWWRLYQFRCVTYFTSREISFTLAGAYVVIDSFSRIVMLFSFWTPIMLQFCIWRKYEFAETCHIDRTYAMRPECGLSAPLVCFVNQRFWSSVCKGVMIGDWMEIMLPGQSFHLWWYHPNWSWLLWLEQFQKAYNVIGKFGESPLWDPFALDVHASRGTFPCWVCVLIGSPMSFE